ncbi:hypothetical protein F5884DRAFT_52352 [Xylogone sp. PMI_703]|nr:hypothetical protein F5884DRAFT_52352 [Xylogone sp. PMI_703]
MLSIKKSSTLANRLSSKSPLHSSQTNSGWRAKLRKTKSHIFLRQASEERNDSSQSLTCADPGKRAITPDLANDKGDQHHGCSPSKWIKKDVYIIDPQKAYNHIDPLRSNVSHYAVLPQNSHDGCVLSIGSEQTASALSTGATNIQAAQDPALESLIASGEMIFGSWPRSTRKLARHRGNRTDTSSQVDTPEHSNDLEISPQHTKRLSDTSIQQDVVKRRRNSAPSISSSLTKASIASAHQVSPSRDKDSEMMNCSALSCLKETTKEHPGREPIKIHHLTSDDLDFRLLRSTGLPPGWIDIHDRFIAYLATHAPLDRYGNIPDAGDYVEHFTSAEIAQMVRERFPQLDPLRIRTQFIESRLHILDRADNDYFRQPYGAYKSRSWGYGI